MDVPGIALAIEDLITGPVKKKPEGDVNGVWNGILNWVFDPVEGYATTPQDQHTGFGGKKGFSDFHTKQRFVDGSHRCFLITQCKRIGKQHDEYTWEEGANQLQDYLYKEHGTRARNQRTPVYGILAVGRRVRFFKYHDLTGSIEDWRPVPQWVASATGGEGERSSTTSLSTPAKCKLR
jgi:hypothetical protein